MFEFPVSVSVLGSRVLYLWQWLRPGWLCELLNRQKLESPMTWYLHRSALGMVQLGLALCACLCFPHVVFSPGTVFCLNTVFFSDAALEFSATVPSVTSLSFTSFPELFYVCKQPNTSFLLIRSSRFTSPRIRESLGLNPPRLGESDSLIRLRALGRAQIQSIS